MTILAVVASDKTSDYLKQSRVQPYRRIHVVLVYVPAILIRAKRLYLVNVFRNIPLAKPFAVHIGGGFFQSVRLVDDHIFARFKQIRLILRTQLFGHEILIVVRDLKVYVGTLCVVV